MKMLPACVLSLSLALAPSSFLHAEDAPAEAPAEKKPAKPVKMPRLTLPWSKMGSLTPEQKLQIGTIHKQASADKKKIDDKEDADIMALLTPEQKTEVEKINEDTAAAKKKTSKPAAETPATQPAADGM